MNAKEFEKFKTKLECDINPPFDEHKHDFCNCEIKRVIDYFENRIEKLCLEKADLMAQNSVEIAKYEKAEKQRKEMSGLHQIANEEREELFDRNQKLEHEIRFLDAKIKIMKKRLNESIEIEIDNEAHKMAPKPAFK